VDSDPEIYQTKSGDYNLVFLEKVYGFFWLSTAEAVLSEALKDPKSIEIYDAFPEDLLAEEGNQRG
jgi:hypothetical protein